MLISQLIKELSKIQITKGDLHVISAGVDITTVNTREVIQVPMNLESLKDIDPTNTLLVVQLDNGDN